MKNFIKQNFLAVSILLAAFMLSVALTVCGMADRFTMIRDGATLGAFDKLTGTTYLTTSKYSIRLSIKDVLRSYKETLNDLKKDDME